MSEDSINQSIELVEEKENIDNSKTDENSLPDAIREINKTLFRDNPKKTANISADNCRGMTSITIINAFMDETYGIRFNSLDELMNDTMQRRMSVNAFGDLTFIEALKSIQASFNSVGESIKNKIGGGLR